MPSSTDTPLTSQPSPPAPPAPTRRSSSHHRLSASHPASGIPIRGSHSGSAASSRTHSHSLSNGSASRVTRRKSTSSNVGNLAAMAAAMANSDSSKLATSVPSNRKSLSSKRSSGLMKGVEGLIARGGLLPSPPSTRPDMVFENEDSKEIAVVDGPPLAAMASPESPSKARMRRASEGSHLIRPEGGRRVASGELKCEKCGKGYKHSSCLTKHLWEHTPEWAYTSKLLISKHQQVQLLEAASVLVQMNQDDPTPPDSARVFSPAVSDHSSASPAASGESDLRDRDEAGGDGPSRGPDEMSSTNTTPPPQSEELGVPVTARRGSIKSKRYSTASSSAYSRSYQSARSSSFSAQSESSGFSNPAFFNRQSGDWTAALSSDAIAASVGPKAAAAAAAAAAAGMADDAGLAAAVGLLSCSYGTPRSGPVNLPPDVPPVPPLPAQYLNSAAATGGNKALTGQHGPVGGETPKPHEDVSMKMDESGDSAADDEEFFGGRPRSASDQGRSEDEEVSGTFSVFGRMEE